MCCMSSLQFSQRRLRALLSAAVVHQCCSVKLGYQLPRDG